MLADCVSDGLGAWESEIEAFIEGDDDSDSELVGDGVGINVVLSVMEGLPEGEPVRVWEALDNDVDSEGLAP